MGIVIAIVCRGTSRIESNFVLFREFRAAIVLKGVQLFIYLFFKIISSFQSPKHSLKNSFEEVLGLNMRVPFRKECMCPLFNPACQYL